MSDEQKEQIDAIFKVAIAILTGIMIPWAVWVTNGIYESAHWRQLMLYRLDMLTATVSKVDARLETTQSEVRKNGHAP